MTCVRRIPWIVIALATLLASAHPVPAQTTSSAVVTLSAKQMEAFLLNAEIIRQGYGFAYTVFPFRMMEQFRALEREAREAGRGLWASR